MLKRKICKESSAGFNDTAPLNISSVNDTNREKGGLVLLGQYGGAQSSLGICKKYRRERTSTMQICAISTSYSSSLGGQFCTKKTVTREIEADPLL